MSAGFTISARIEGQHYLSMEYLDGEDLNSLIRRIGRLPQDKAIEFTRKICTGLAAAQKPGDLQRRVARVRSAGAFSVVRAINALRCKTPPARTERSRIVRTSPVDSQQPRRRTAYTTSSALWSPFGTSRKPLLIDEGKNIVWCCAAKACRQYIES